MTKGQILTFLPFGKVLDFELIQYRKQCCGWAIERRGVKYHFINNGVEHKVFFMFGSESAGLHTILSMLSCCFSLLYASGTTRFSTVGFFSVITVVFAMTSNKVGVYKHAEYNFPLK